MFATKPRWSALAALVIAAACGEVAPTAPAVRTIRPSFNLSGDPATTSFCSSAPFRIPVGPFTSGPAELYPSSVDVSGVGSGDFKITVTVRRISHTFAADIDMLLVGPTGATVMLMSDIGRGSDLNAATLTFDDDAADFVAPPEVGADIPSGTYKPSPDAVEPEDMAPPAPVGPYGSSFAALAGTNPNGTWRLFVQDDLGGDTGGIGEGWCVNITSSSSAPVANAGGPYAADEGTSITFDGTLSSGPNGGVLSYAWNFGDGTTGEGAQPTHAYADNGTYEVTLVVTDGAGAVSAPATATATVTNAAPEVTAISLPADPVAVGTPITIGASFTDAGTADTHAASFDLGNGQTATGTIGEGGSVAATVSYAAPGVYTIHASVTDDDGATGTRSSTLDVPAYVVVYDPSGGFVTGGGWIESPEGAYAADPSLTGRATFGFVAKYHHGATTPDGNTQFHFHAGSLNFSSTSYEWLVVAGNKAKYKGVGTINGEGRYGFMLTAIDDRTEEGKADAFRIKIWDLETESVLYDNRKGAGDNSNAATLLGGGSIVIHK